MNETWKEWRKKIVCLEIRFLNREDHALVKQAAAQSGDRSMNAWLVRVVLAAARRQLKVK